MTMDKRRELRTQLPIFSLSKRLSGGQGKEGKNKRIAKLLVGSFFFFSFIGFHGGCFPFLVNGGWFIFLKETFV